MYRTLGKVETWKEPWARVIRLALHEIWRRLAGDLCLPNDRSFGVKAFDKLSRGQQLYLVRRVARCLLIEDVAPVPLYQTVEATTATLFCVVRGELSVEIDTDAESEPTTRLRKAVLALFEAECNADGALRSPTLDCDDHETWHGLVDHIEGTILYDDDYTEDAALVSALPGTDEDYFDWVPRRPTPENRRMYARDILELTGEVATE